MFCFESVFLKLPLTAARILEESFWASCNVFFSKHKKYSLGTPPTLKSAIKFLDRLAFLGRRLKVEECRVVFKVGPLWKLS